MDLIMLAKHALFLMTFLGSATAFAIPIENRGLSQADGSGSYNTANQSSSSSGASNIGATVPNAVAGNMNWNLYQKNQELEAQIRDLRGKLEEQDNTIDQLSKDLQNRYTDIDKRIELLNQKIDPPEEQSDENGEGDHQQAVPNNSNSVAAPATKNTTAQPTTANNQASSNNVAVKNNVNTSDSKELEKAAYTVALDAYKKGGAKQAIAPMQNFIKSYPNSVYTGNAHFWLAEFNLAIDPPNYNEAKKNYEIVAAKFPDSAKAPRALYQLYSISKDVNKNMASANVYKTKLLNTYPKSEEAGYFKKS